MLHFPVRRIALTMTRALCCLCCQRICFRAERIATLIEGKGSERNGSAHEARAIRKSVPRIN
jgi:hypothetical protein